MVIWMTEKQFKITDEFDDCFYIREKDNEALTTAKDFENKLNEQYEIIQSLKQELFEAKKDYLIETADISDTQHLDEDIEELRQEIFDDDKSNKIFIQSYSIKPEYGGNFNL